MIAAPIATLPGHWMNEKDIKDCMECQQAFNSFTRRKHHCRVCGKVVCFNCSQHSVADPAHPTTGKIRACNTCFARSQIASDDGSPHLNITPPTTMPPSPSYSSIHPSDLSNQTPVVIDSLDLSLNTNSPSHSRLHSRSVSSVFTPVRPASPLLDSQHPLPMPLFASNSAVENTVASVTAILLEEEAQKAKAVTALPFDTTVEETSSHPSLTIVVPPKSLEVDPHFVAPITSSEPVSPSAALEQHLRQNGTGGGLTPQPVSPLPASPTPTSSPHAPTSPSTPQEEPILLDLPMKLCLVILKRTAHDMKARYSEYLRTKEERHEQEPLSFQQFMFFSTIRTLPDFLFKKTDLAYCMMRDEGSQIVGRDAFIRYAPILPPLASKVDAGAVFDCMAMDLPEGRGISLPLFKLYVDNLQKQYVSIDKEWEGWRDDFELSKSETMISVRHGVSDTTHFPPHMGTVGFTNHHVIYASVFKKRRRIAWLDILRVERNTDGFLRRHDHAGIKLHFNRESKEEKEEKEEKLLHKTDDTLAVVPAHHSAFRRKSSRAEEEKSAIKVINWDVPGISADALHEKQRFFLHLRLLYTSQHLAVELTPTQPLIAAALLQESFDLVRRMKALEGVAPHVEPLKLNPYGDFTDSAKQEFVKRIREVVKKTERVKESKKSWLTNILPGLSAGGESKGVKDREDIDPEFKPQYKTMEEMNSEVKEAEPFSVKAFSYNVKLFSRQLQPIAALLSFVKKVRNWDNPLLTASIIAFLLNMCYRDYLVYLPAIVMLLNIVAVITFYFDPDALTRYLDQLEHEKEVEEAVDDESTTGSAPVIISTVGTSGAATPGLSNGVPVATAVTVVRKKEVKDEKEPKGLLAKLKEYRDVAFKTKDHLETVQHGLADLNLKTIRVEGLYKWTNPTATSKFLAILCVLVVVLCVVPFRFIFPIVLIDWVTDKWQKEGSQVDRLLQEVPLPDVMPELD